MAAASALLLVLGAAPAQAAWTPEPEILSVDNARREQSDGANANVDLADGGRYVVFQTRATNFFDDADPDPAGVARQGGVFRADRQSGALALVADGDQLAADGSGLRVRGAANPSVSADGRFVVFSTGQALVPQDTNGNVDVYVRDMDVPLTTDRAASGAFELVSALTGTTTAAAYDNGADGPATGRSSGSTVFPGAAISADGRYVAFRTQDRRSDLAGTGPLGTPPFVVLVRDRQSRRTVVVSRNQGTGAAEGGAEAPVVLSGDGSTVAWVGGHAQAQTRFLPGETGDDSIPFYLWRRWDDTGAQTRRITGSVDPDDPACPAGGRAPIGPTETGPCAGPLTDLDQGSNSIAAVAPALSADGLTVAFLSGASPRPSGDTNPGLDAYVTDMRPGVTRKAGTRAITLDTASNNAAANGEVQSVALSADGRHLAFTTSRTLFLLPKPTLTGPQRGVGSPVELYVVDLAANTMERAVFGPSAVDANGPVLAGISLSPDGTQAGLVSGATNLLVGDANEQPDVFVAKLAPPSAPAGPIAIRPRAPAQLPVAPPPAPAALVARATSNRDGSVSVRVTAGQPGVLIATVPAPKGTHSLVRLRRTFKAKGTQTLALELTGKALVGVRRGKALAARAKLVLTPAAPAKAQAKTLKVTFRVVKRRRGK